MAYVFGFSAQSDFLEFNLFYIKFFSSSIRAVQFSISSFLFTLVNFSEFIIVSYFSFEFSRKVFDHLT